MRKPSLPDNISHQLENLSIEQLLEVRAKVDALLANKSVIPRLSNKSNHDCSVSIASTTYYTVKKTDTQRINLDRFLQQGKSDLINNLYSFKKSSIEAIAFAELQNYHKTMSTGLQEKVEEEDFDLRREIDHVDQKTEVTFTKKIGSVTNIPLAPETTEDQSPATKNPSKDEIHTLSMRAFARTRQKYSNAIKKLASY
jgi:hypothetical protein